MALLQTGSLSTAAGQRSIPRLSGGKDVAKMYPTWDTVMITREKMTLEKYRRMPSTFDGEDE